MLVYGQGSTTDNHLLHTQVRDGRLSSSLQYLNKIHLPRKVASDLAIHLKSPPKVDYKLRSVRLPNSCVWSYCSISRVYKGRASTSTKAGSLPKSCRSSKQPSQESTEAACMIRKRGEQFESHILPLSISRDSQSKSTRLRRQKTSRTPFHNPSQEIAKAGLQDQEDRKRSAYLPSIYLKSLPQKFSRSRRRKTKLSSRETKIVWTHRHPALRRAPPHYECSRAFLREKSSRAKFNQMKRDSQLKSAKRQDEIHRHQRKRKVR